MQGCSQSSSAVTCHRNLADAIAYWIFKYNSLIDNGSELRDFYVEAGQRVVALWGGRQSIIIWSVNFVLIALGFWPSTWKQQFFLNDFFHPQQVCKVFLLPCWCIPSDVLSETPNDIKEPDHRIKPAGLMAGLYYWSPQHDIGLCFFKSWVCFVVVVVVFCKSLRPTPPQPKCTTHTQKEWAEWKTKLGLIQHKQRVNISV